MNEFGRLGGSNIVNAKTGVSEIIKNGSFEVLNPNTGDPEYWNVGNNNTSFNVDSTLAHSGKNSMRLDVTEETPVHSPLYQLIDPVLFVGGERYRITYWIKTLNMSLNSYWFESLIHSETGDWYLHIASLRGPIQDSDWLLVEYDFTYPLNNSTSNIRLDFYPEIPAEFQLWIDDISLKKI